MNQELADQARQAITDSAFVDIPHRCEQWAREVIQAVYGTVYDDAFQATARLTAFRWVQMGLGFPIEHFGGQEGIELGDVLYKTQNDGPDGHVGIYVGSQDVAENSSTPIGRVRGACGYRTLEQFGHIDVVVRLPSPIPPYQLYLNDRYVLDMPVIDGTAYCPVRAWGQAMGFSVSWDNSTGKVDFNGAVVNTPVTLIGGHAYLPIRVLAEAAGLTVDVGPDRRVTVTRPA